MAMGNRCQDADHIGDIGGEQNPSLRPLHKDGHETANEPWQEGGWQEVEVTQNVPEGVDT